MLIYHVTCEWPTVALMSCLFLCMASHHFDVSIKLISYVLKPIQSCPMFC